MPPAPPARQDTPSGSLGGEGGCICPSLPPATGGALAILWMFWVFPSDRTLKWWSLVHYLNVDPASHRIQLMSMWRHSYDWCYQAFFVFCCSFIFVHYTERKLKNKKQSGWVIYPPLFLHHNRGDQQWPRLLTFTTLGSLRASGFNRQWITRGGSNQTTDWIWKLLLIP